MKKQLKKIPAFKSDEEFGEFWLTHDLTDYYDLAKAEKMKFVRIEGTNYSLNFQLPERLIKKIESRAKSERVPVTVLMKRYVEEGLARVKSAAR